MIRLDYLVLGYVTFHIECEDVARASDRFLKNGLTIKISKSGKFFVRASEAERVKRILDKIPYSVSGVGGLYGLWLRGKRRYGFILAAVITLFLTVLSSDVVWDVRIEGCDEEEKAEIISELSDAGLSVGSLWHRISRSSVENRALIGSDSISWLNINRRGSVAYVTVVPKIVHEIPEEKVGYANVVATVDCVIEEITVKEGIALVKVGESVRRGEVLISGIIPTELGGGYCYAEGSVKGRYSDSVLVEIPSSVTEKVYTKEKTGRVSVEFFGFPINIFKIYGNSEKMCDIIEKKQDITLAGDRLPLSYTVTTLCEYEEYTRTLSADEMTAMAAEALNAALLDRLSASDLMGIRCGGEFSADGYSMWADVIVRGDVNKTQEFEFKPE